MRIKRGFVKHRRRKRMVRCAKGYFGAKRKLFKKAKEQLMKSYQYQYSHRKKRKIFFRQLWIMRINSALSQYDLKYSIFMHQLKLLNIQLNRKILNKLILHSPKGFEMIVNMVNKNLTDIKNKEDKK